MTEKEDSDLKNPAVVGKYTDAAKIANDVLREVIENIKDGADVFKLCRLGDDMLEEQTQQIYNQKIPQNTPEEEEDEKVRKIEKGIATPTCISINEVICGYSPLSDNESKQIKNGDVCKVELGCHINGYAALVSHTVVCGEAVISDRRADCIQAAYTASQAAYKTIQAGISSSEVVRVINEVLEAYECKAVVGTSCHQIKQHLIDGKPSFLLRESPDDKQKSFLFEAGQAYSIDIFCSTGEGKPKTSDDRTTVYKRNVEVNYVLKTQKARNFMSVVDKKYPTLLFSLSDLKDETVARIGVSEALRHNLLISYPVTKEKEGEFISQFRFVILILPSGILKKITGLEFVQKSIIQTTKKCPEEIEKLLRLSMNPREQKKRMKKEES